MVTPETCSGRPAASQQVLTGRKFFPGLISGPFHQGLSVVFAVAAALAVLAALASLLRGGRNPRPAAASEPPRPAAGTRPHRAAGR